MLEISFDWVDLFHRLPPAYTYNTRPLLYKAEHCQHWENEETMKIELDFFVWDVSFDWKRTRRREKSSSRKWEAKKGHPGHPIWPDRLFFLHPAVGFFSSLFAIFLISICRANPLTMSINIISSRLFCVNILIITAKEGTAFIYSCLFFCPLFCLVRSLVLTKKCFSIIWVYYIDRPFSFSFPFRANYFIDIWMWLQLVQKLLNLTHDI